MLETSGAPARDLLVYDVGMNNGDDSAYYLAKGLRVVGIDANPQMCEICSTRFEREIADGRMTIVNAGVSDDVGLMDFHVNEAKPAISTFVPERFDQDWVPRSWRVVPVGVKPLSHIIGEHGDPYFIKIDVEFFDKNVLRDLLLNGIHPPFISAEAHEIDVYCLLVSMGYSRFSIVNGNSVHLDYGQATISRVDGQSFAYNFPPESSGPFGGDLSSPWLGKDEILAALLEHGLGWRDLHAAL